MRFSTTTIIKKRSAIIIYAVKNKLLSLQYKSKAHMIRIRMEIVADLT